MISPGVFIYFLKNTTLCNKILFFIFPLQQFFLIKKCFSSSSINPKKKFWGVPYLLHMCMIFFSFLHQCFAESFFFVNFSCQIKIPYFLLQMIFLVFQCWFHCYSIFILKSYFCKIWKSCSSLIGIQHGFCKYFLMVRPAVITFCCSIYIQIDFGNILLTYISLDQIHSGGCW